MRNQLLVLVGILVLAGGAFYTALVVTTQAYPIFFPGKQINIGIKAPGIGGGDASAMTGRRINFLVLGIDRRPNEGSENTRSDTMFVMSVDPQTRSARALAIPRDLWVDIPGPRGVFKGRINSAYPLGGVDTAVATVERLLGINIDHYVIIDFEGFREIVTLLGGVEVEVPDGLGVNDPFYSETELRGDFYPCIFPPGKYHMDGSQALCYSRVRSGSDDRERILRQQTVIDAVIRKATQLDILSSPGTMLELWRRYKNTVQTDVNDLHVGGFALMAAGMDRDSISYLSLGVVTTGWTTPDGAQVLLASQEGIKLLVEAFTSDYRLEEEAAVIEVHNATGREGEEHRAVEFFLGFGIAQELALPGTVAVAPVKETQIVDFSNKRYTAQRIAGWLSIPANRIRAATPEDEVLRSNPASDIVVILGADSKIELESAARR